MVTLEERLDALEKKANTLCYQIYQETKDRKWEERELWRRVRKIGLRLDRFIRRTNKEKRDVRKRRQPDSKAVIRNGGKEARGKLGGESKERALSAHDDG